MYSRFIKFTEVSQVLSTNQKILNVGKIKKLRELQPRPMFPILIGDQQWSDYSWIKWNQQPSEAVQWKLAKLFTKER